MEEVWPEPGFSRLRECLAPSGVYCLLWQGTVVYVGKSANIFARLSTHHRNLLRKTEGKPKYMGTGAVFVFDDVWVKWVEPEKLDYEEFKLIQRFRPMHNIKHNHEIRKLPNLPAFAELLARAKGSPIRRRPVSKVPYERRRVNP